MKNRIYFFIVLSFFILLITACNYHDASKDPLYKKLIGKEYTLLKGFYLVRFAESRNASNSPPIVSIWQGGTESLPQKVHKDNIGRKIKGMEIIEVAPKNSRFILKKILKNKINDNIEILIPIISLSPKYNNVEASSLVDEYAHDFSLNKKLVKEVKN